MNWCAADVYDLYGDAGINFQTSLSLPTDDLNTEVIYPDQNPRGESTAEPAEMQRTCLQGLPEPDGRARHPAAGRRVGRSAAQRGTTAVPPSCLPSPQDGPRRPARELRHATLSDRSDSELQSPVYGPQTPNSWNDPRR